jgi:adenine deaminase
MDKKELTQLIDTAAGRRAADLVLRGAKIANVFSGTFETGDLALCGGNIAAIGKEGEYDGKETLDCRGKFILPALIDSHIHIESSFLSPEEFAALVVPHGTGTVVSDPHEIVNVAGFAGLDYMLEAAALTPLNFIFMLPSCVPVTRFEHSGFELPASEMPEELAKKEIAGLGEFMDYKAVAAADSACLDKILLALNSGKIIDGHSPGLAGPDLSAYAAAGVSNDHECTTPEELIERTRRGMYVMLREGSACHDLENLLPALVSASGVAQASLFRRCLFCSDDLQSFDALQRGHIEKHLRAAVNAGVDPMLAIQMATLNAAESYRLTDRGALAPGRRADFIIVDNLKDFNVERVWLGGKLVAENGRYLPTVKRAPTASVSNKMRVKDFSREKLALPVNGGTSLVLDVEIGGIITAKSEAAVDCDAAGNWIYTPGSGIAKIAVVERHKNTGCVGVGLIRGYGISSGAIAQSVAHDSHNIMVCGVDDGDMELVVRRLVQTGGGLAIARDGKLLAELPLPIGGLMSDKNAQYVAEHLRAIEEVCHSLGVSKDVDPMLTLAFMSLIVVPHIKITDQGLFDVDKFEFIR